MEFLNYINGTFSASQNQSTLTKHSPFDGSVLGQVAQSDAMDLILALPSAKKALAASEKITVEQRAVFLGKIADELTRRADEISLQEALHQGLPQAFVLENSIRVAISIFRKTAEDLRHGSGENILMSPVGIIGIVVAWPLSLRLITERLAPALAAGNVVIIKASEHSPVTGQILAEIFSAIDLPPGLVSVLQGGAEVAQALAGHPSVRGISAVGRTTTVEALVKAAVPQLKRIQMSSGAKNATLVLGETDFKNLMPEILQPFLLGQAQMCWNSSRIFILESMQQEFIAAMTSYLDSLKPSVSPTDNSPWTPMISAEARKGLAEKIQLAQTDHGKILWGGRSPEGPGYFSQPTVMLDVTNCSILQQDEVHGPLLLVTPVKYQHEMQKWVNTSYLAHSAVLWGPSEKTLKVAAKIDVAHVWLNSWMAGDSDIICGHKQSSFGIQDYRWNGGFFSDAKKLTTGL